MTAALLLSSCGQEGSVAGASDRSAGAAESTEPSPEDVPEEDMDPTAGTSPAHPPLVAAAIADLADSAGVQEASIEVVSVEEVTWTDGSLGCAEEGMSYTQALVEGSRIVLRVDGAEHEYHSGGGAAPFRCERPTQ
jgi:hypothetical protein